MLYIFYFNHPSIVIKPPLRLKGNRTHQVTQHTRYAWFQVLGFSYYINTDSKQLPVVGWGKKGPNERYLLQV